MRIITINMWGRGGPWRQRWRIAARDLALLQADVLCMQEVDDRDLLAEVVRACGLRVAAADLASSCLAVLTRGPAEGEVRRFRTISPHEGTPRSCCLVRLPSGATLANTHLSWRKEDAASRRGQVAELASELRGQPSLVCGDFNCELGAPELAPLLSAGFMDVCTGTAAAARPTWDNRNPFTLPYRSQYPDMRIDLVLAGGAFLGLHPLQDARVVLDQPDAETGLYVSDHFGVMAEFGD